MSKDLPASWVIGTIDQVCTHPQYGWTCKAQPKGYLKLLRTTDITSGLIDWDTVPYCSETPKKEADYYLCEGDIVVSRAGSVGKSYIIKGKPPKAVFASYLVRFKPHVEKYYVYYFMQSRLYWSQIEEKSAGIAVPNVNGSKLAKISLPIAPLNEQKRIVDRIEQLFSDIDKGEELLKTVQKQLATYRQSVLKAAVTGELTKDWREKNKKKLESGEKLLVRILESRRKNWQGRGKHKDVPSIDRSELLELPNGWTWATPEHLVSDAPNSLCIGPFGSNLKVDDYTDAGVPLVFVRHIRAKNFDGLKPQYVSAKKAKELSSHKVIGGDILITKMGEPPGDVCIYPENHPDAIITADCIRFSPQRELLDTKYLELALNSRPVQTQIQGITKGVAQQKVTLGNFKKVVIPLPGLDEQKEIANICDEKFSQIYALEAWCEAQLSRSNALRQSILKSAFSGKLVVQDPADEPASELLARIKSGDSPKAKAKAVAPSRGRKPRSDKSEAA